MAMEAKDFLILNPLVYGDLQKYIWIDNTRIGYCEAQNLFGRLLQNHIYISGFASDDVSLVNLRIYNKKIVNVEALSEVDSIIFANFDSLTNVELKIKVHNILIVNPEMSKENIVIWGAGITGEHVCRILAKNDIKIKCFVDTNTELEGKVRCGYPVYMPDKLDEIGEKVTIIEAMEQWKLLDEDIQEKYKKRFHYSLSAKLWHRITCNVGGTERVLIDLKKYWYFHYFADKKIYVYGNGEAERAFVEYLELLDYDFGGFLVDEMEKENEDYVCGRGGAGYAARRVEEIVYESNFYIWIYDKGKAERLKQLGLRYCVDFISHAFWRDTTIVRKEQLDVNLGYNYIVKGSMYPGIVVSGEEDPENYKIAILGNSTSDATLYPFKSWPELLYRKLAEENIIVYNGAACGYDSGQELIKLVRDVLPLEPDMVLVYDGYNDFFWTDACHPFAFIYAKQVYEYAKGNLESLDDRGEILDEVCWGIETKKEINRFDNWLANIRSMYAITRERKICFYSFCQPMLGSKSGKNVREQEMLMSMDFDVRHKLTGKTFRKIMDEMPEKPDYIYDLSDIFDNQNDIYMDACHVWEKGNQIIAEEIKKVILPEITKRRAAENRSASLFKGLISKGGLERSL